MEEKEQPLPENSMIVDKPVIVKDAKVEFMTKAAFKNSLPRGIQNYIKGILYICVGLPTVLIASNLFSEYQLKVVGLCLSIVGLICGAIEVSTGVKAKD